MDRRAVEGRHWLNQSLYVGYQVMLPNYLLGAHGDRIFAANSVEGRYPFLARDVVSYSAGLHPDLKLKGMREKYVLRRSAAKWLTGEAAWRPKRRFSMPFGTPFAGPDAPALFSRLLSPMDIEARGYFDAARVRQSLAALGQAPRTGGRARRYLDRLAAGLAINFVASTQLWDYLFVEGNSVKDVLEEASPALAGEELRPVVN
jgi:asparagine synthase (glutamine-hydrolysing)